MIVAPDALNRLVANLSDSSSNMNLLLSFTGWAFHRHHDIRLVGLDRLTPTPDFITRAGDCEEGNG